MNINSFFTQVHILFFQVKIKENLRLSSISHDRIKQSENIWLLIKLTPPGVPPGASVSRKPK